VTGVVSSKGGQEDKNQQSGNFEQREKKTEVKICQTWCIIFPQVCSNSGIMRQLLNHLSYLRFCA